MLRQYGVAFCLVDMPGHRSEPVATTDFVYVRFHGPDRLYSSNYDPERFKVWASDIRTLCGGTLPVFAYFNNDVNAYAVDNALTLRGLLSAP